jgi:hypothetical protein
METLQQRLYSRENIMCLDILGQIVEIFVHQKFQHPLHSKQHFFAENSCCVLSNPLALSAHIISG